MKGTRAFQGRSIDKQGQGGPPLTGQDYKRLRKRLGSQVEAAQKLGLTRHTIARNEAKDLVPGSAALVMRAAVITPNLYEKLRDIVQWIDENAAVIGAASGKVLFPAQEALEESRELAEQLGAGTGEEAAE